VCTLALAFQADRRWPLVVAANRDERLGRPSEDWALRAPPGEPRHVAPRDALAGGTWIGVGASGLFAGITNFHAAPGHPPDPSRRSRGELVTRMLGQPSARTAREHAARAEAAAYNPFHLLVADASTAFLWWYDGDVTEIEDLGPGLHVATERDPRGRDPRGEAVRARWPVDPTPPRLRELLSSHDAFPSSPGVCIHLGDVYGTRSSAVIRLAPALHHSELFAADGPPCTSPFEDRSGLLVSLARSP
jgi:uncharacterized protein with NRDE domain